MVVLNDRWYRIIGVPLVALVSNIIFYYDMNERHGFGFLSDYFYTLVIVFLLWEVSRQVIIYTRRRFYAYADWRKRIIWTGIGTVGLTVLLMTAISAFYDITNWWGYTYTWKNYLYNNFAALTYCILIGGIYEGVYYFNQWRNAAVEAEAMKKENLQSQFDSLKLQMSPHFLFNSLNTLSSLIRKDADRAELFVDELSRVYRYLLRNSEDSLTDLRTEVNFIQSFFHLLNTRYVNSITLSITIYDKHYGYFLPPLTLQLLIENAVKHNIVDKDSPLHIRIESLPDEALLVSNNLQRKLSQIPSNKIGLANIVNRYRFLGAAPVFITETADEFKVKIPLLSSKLV